MTEERERIFAYTEIGFGKALLTVRPQSQQVRWIGLVGLVPPAERTLENMVHLVTEELGAPDPPRKLGLVARFLGHHHLRAVWTRPWGGPSRSSGNPETASRCS